ncbi:MAG: hypothetical protein M3459_04265, partial [Actinomycetota bacterium]|nr:hypothetical protein [Actinomycetota bacterium]
MRDDWSITRPETGESTNHPRDGLAGPAGSLTARLSALAEELRNAGVTAGVDALLDAHRALAAVDPANRSDARLALRLTMCSKRTDLEAFDRAFVRVFGAGEHHDDQLSGLGEVPRSALPHAGVPPAPGQEPPRPLGPQPVPAAFSDVETLSTKDFAQLTDAELASTHAIMARLARRGPQRRSR